jgi:uncharacterized protein (DUF2062 family)
MPLRWAANRYRRFRSWLRAQLVEHLERPRVFWAIFLGITIGVTPFWGLHFVACVFFARVLRLNKGLMVLGSGIANPITVPPLLAFEAAVGSFVRTGHFGMPAIDFSGDYRPLLAHGGWLLFDLIVGSLIVGPAVGAPLGALGAAWIRRHPPKAPPTGG